MPSRDPTAIQPSESIELATFKGEYGGNSYELPGIIDRSNIGCDLGFKGRSAGVENSPKIEACSEVECSPDAQVQLPALPPRLADSARDTRSLKYRMEPVTFKGTYGGHAYELNSTIDV